MSKIAKIFANVIKIYLFFTNIKLSKNIDKSFNFRVLRNPTTMKFFLFICSSFFLSGLACAQPTLTSANAGMIPGDQLTVKNNNGVISPGASGPDISWDFSDLSGSQTIIYSAKYPSECTNGSSFPDATVAFSTTGSDEFYSLSANSWEKVGLDAQGIVIKYTNPEKLLSFPLTYNATRTDSFSATYSYMSYTAKRKGLLTYTADAYGTLILPGKTYTNVLRVKFVETSTDYLMSTALFSSTSTMYHFYVPSFHFPLLTINNIAPGNGAQREYYNYIDGTTGIEDNFSAQSSLQIHPNPATDILNFNFDARESLTYKLSIVNTLGLTVREFDSENVSQGPVEKTISLEGLSKGLYFANIRIEGKQHVKKFIIK